VDVQLGVDAARCEGFEVTVTATVHTKIGENGVSRSEAETGRHFSKSAT
jgi:hypothetical protein